MPMSPRLLRPRSTVHPEAQAWATRVTVNGGTVSASTLAAVSKFCRDIDAAGIRDKFYRLNLFCGDNLSAALVPLYRSESLTASVRGNATDTNTNFVSGDFNNTGSSAGLKGNGSNKSLSTGLSGDSTTGANTHLAVSLLATQTGAVDYKCLVGIYYDTPTFQASNLYARRNDSGRAAAFGNAGQASVFFGDAVQSTALAIGHIIAAYPAMYRNGAATGTNGTRADNAPAGRNYEVFAINNNGAVQQHTDARLGGYSIGLTMTAAQALAYSNAISAFNLALSRS